MRKWILVMVLVLAMAVPTFATNWGDTYNDYDYAITNQGGQGGAGGSVGNVSATGGAGGNAVVNDNSKTYNTNTNLNTNLNSNSNRNENTNTNIGINSQKQGQGQLQGQGQNQEINNGQVISPSQSIVIEAQKRAYLGAPSVGVPELNFGQGKVDWYFANALPKIGIPLYQSNEEIKEVLDTVANVPIKKVLKVALKIKKSQIPLCYNVRLIVVKAEAQKTWNSGGSLNGAGSYIGNAGSSASGSLVPSVGGTKANDLYTIIIVKTVK